MRLLSSARRPTFGHKATTSHARHVLHLRSHEGRQLDHSLPLPGDLPAGLAGGNSALKYRKAEVNRSNGSETVQRADSSNASASAHARGGGSGILEFSLKSRYQKLTNPGDA